MSYYHFVWKAILLLIMAIAILRTLDAGQNGYLNLACRILTVVLVVVFTVWSVDTVLWLAVQILQYPSALQSLGHSHQDWVCLRTNPLSYETSAEHGWLHCGPPGAGHFVKMVHNGIEYGIMQAYAEGFNILHEANAGQHTLKRVMLRLLRWIIRRLSV